MNDPRPSLSDRERAMKGAGGAKRRMSKLAQNMNKIKKVEMVF